jgi:polar amino acid transport system substrate-binding protein
MVNKKSSFYLFALSTLIGASEPMLATAQPAGEPATTEEGRTFQVPSFRHIDSTQPVPDLRAVKTVRFLTDDDFPPFSYREGDGELTGFNVSLARGLCADLRLTCEFIPTPWEDLIPALERGAGDAILAGLKISQATVGQLDFTRPYYRSLARFAVRAESPLAEADLRSLAGKRVGVLTGTAHEAYLAANFGRSNIRPFPEETEAREALRTGRIDALFDDATRHMFWLAAEDSRGCCEFAKGAYVAPDYFSPPMAIAVKRGNETLREVLDYGLDRLQTSGAFAETYRRFFPMSPW